MFYRWSYENKRVQEFDWCYEDFTLVELLVMTSFFFYVR